MITSPENAELARRDPKQNAKREKADPVRITGLCHVFVLHVIVIQRLHRILDELCSLGKIMLD